jgi:hypothetical protein
MANYRITGVWKVNNVITHYAFHEISADGKTISPAKKTNKKDAISFVENPFNEVYTWIWDYKNSCWKNGSEVHVVGSILKFLRTNHDNTQVDNLNHLIDYSYIY